MLKVRGRLVYPQRAIRASFIKDTMASEYGENRLTADRVSKLVNK